MPITPFGWQDGETGGTPLDAANLEAANSHGGAYTDTTISSEVVRADAGYVHQDGTGQPVTVVKDTNGANVPLVDGSGNQVINVPPFVAAKLYPGGFVIQVSGSLYSRNSTGTSGASFGADSANWTIFGSISGVTTFNTRSGVVAPTSGDYTAGQVTNAADKSSGSVQTFTGIIASPAHSATGLTGATSGARFVGATASGSPLSGTFVTGDVVIDQSGGIWVCTAGGTPGTWTKIGSTGLQPTYIIASGSVAIPAGAGHLRVTMSGGGGGGGGGQYQTSATENPAGAGGSAGFILVTYLSLSGISGLSATIGGAGTGGSGGIAPSTAANTGNFGGLTTLTGTGLTTLTAQGGPGGRFNIPGNLLGPAGNGAAYYAVASSTFFGPTPNTILGSGGTGYAGTGANPILVSGGGASPDPGSWGYPMQGVGGGGGGAGTSSGGTAGAPGAPGIAGLVALAHSNGAAGTSASANTGCGGGGGGAGFYGGSNANGAAGGNGGSGWMLIEWFS